MLFRSASGRIAAPVGARPVSATAKEAELCFQRWDKDGNGELDKEELIGALGELNVSTDEAAAKKILDKFDGDKNGVLDLAEFQAMFEKLKSFRDKKPTSSKRTAKVAPDIPSPPPALAHAPAPDVSNPVNVEASSLEGSALVQAAIAGVMSTGQAPWLHVRLMVRGVGTAGKTAIIRAMQGRALPDDGLIKSTVGAECVELQQNALQLKQEGSGGKQLQEYCCEGAGEYDQAVAMRAAEVCKQNDDGETELVNLKLDDHKCTGSRIEDVRKALQESRQQSTVIKPSPDSGGATAPEKPDIVGSPGKTDGLMADASGEGGAVDDITGAALGHVAPMPTDDPNACVSPALVQKILDGHQQRSLVMRVQDTGGQPVFLSLLDLLTTPTGTVYLIVFDLSKLATGFDDGARDTINQLKSIHLFARGASVLLAGTRKDDVEGYTAGDDARSSPVIMDLSKKLNDEMKDKCAPIMGGLIKYDGGPEPLCFFPVENSKGIQNDPALADLVDAIDNAARKLPSLSKLMPLRYLRFYDFLRAAKDNPPHKRCLKLAPDPRVPQAHNPASADDAQTMCELAGLPHENVPIDLELTHILTEFHALGSLLWYDEPVLRNIVILDPLWVIDAVTYFLRQFDLPDHRMDDVDTEASRAADDEWQLLKGQATLKNKLLDIFWSHKPDRGYMANKDALIRLLTKFRILIPLKDQSFLVPALLKVNPNAAPTPPAGWPPADPSPAQLRIFFFCKSETKRDPLFFEPIRDASGGFLPIAVFHKLCAGALGCSSGLADTHLTRNVAFIAFDDHPPARVKLECVEGESSIKVTLNTPGTDGSAGNVADKLRVLLIEELSDLYPNLDYRMTVPLPRQPREVDLDELPKAKQLDVTVQLDVDGQDALQDVHGLDGLKRLKDKFAFWMTTVCTFTFVKAEMLRKADSATLPMFEMLQELEKKPPPEWTVQKTITFDGIVSSEYEKEYLALSYRWEDATGQPTDHPDPRRVQLDALQAYLNSNEGQAIKYVFVDFMCLYQDKGSFAGKLMPKQKAQFKSLLPNINMLYLACTVLIIMFDDTYMKRFWPQFEAWLAHQTCDIDGLHPRADLKDPQTGQIDKARLRCVTRLIETAQGTPYEDDLTLRWIDKSTAQQAMTELRKECYTVTNQSDKDVQLYKVEHIDYMVKRTALARAGGARAADGGAALAPPVTHQLSASAREFLTDLGDDLTQYIAKFEEDAVTPKALLQIFTSVDDTGLGREALHDALNDMGVKSKVHRLKIITKVISSAGGKDNAAAALGKLEQDEAGSAA